MGWIDEWIASHETLMWGLGIGSFILFVLSLVLLPAVIIKLPENFLANLHSRSLRNFVEAEPGEQVFVVMKNILAVLLVLLGIALLVLPGQGILAIIIGLALMDFPGKRWLVCRVMGQKNVLESANWIRRKAGVSPLEGPR